jgi:hypothetical protein
MQVGKIEVRYTSWNNSRLIAAHKFSETEWGSTEE